jgi:hypothetical protein
VDDLGVDLLTIAGHQLYAPKRVSQKGPLAAYTTRAPETPHADGLMKRLRRRVTAIDSSNQIALFAEEELAVAEAVERPQTIAVIFKRSDPREIFLGAVRLASLDPSASGANQQRPKLAPCSGDFDDSCACGAAA